MRVLVVGSGIAGLSGALHLLRRGARVTVAERRKGRIDRVCGEGILPFGVALLEELGLAGEVRAAGRSFKGISYGNGDRVVDGDFAPGVTGIGIERGKLDGILRAACEAEPGFEAWPGYRAGPKDASRFDRVLVADGIHARWAVAEGRKVRFGDRLGLRFRVEAEPPERVTVRFCEGYEIYLTPTGGAGLSVAFLMDRRRLPAQGGDLKRVCPELFRAAFPRYADAEITDLATRGPISSRPRHGRERVHLLGDAMRAFDPISGAGMSFALLCASLAARHIDDTAAYRNALAPHMAAIGAVTRLVLFFRGGGRLTRLMLRQLELAPESFAYLLAVHDGNHRAEDLRARKLLPLLRPF